MTGMQNVVPQVPCWLTFSEKVVTIFPDNRQESHKPFEINVSAFRPCGDASPCPPGGSVPSATAKSAADELGYGRSRPAAGRGLPDLASDVLAPALADPNDRMQTLS